MATAPSSDRVEWIDFARGLGIILVVVGHTWRGLWNADILQDAALYDQLDAAIYLFHMPLFFCLSGLTFAAADRRRGRGPTVFTALAWRCLYPLTLWTYLFVLLRIAAGQLANSPTSWADLPLFPIPPLEFLWFLWAIFLIQLAMMAVHRIVGFGWCALGLGVLIAILGELFLRSEFSSPLAFRLVAQAVHYMPFFLIGMVLAVLPADPLWLIRKRPWFAALLALAAFLPFAATAPDLMAHRGFVRWIMGGVAMALFLALSAALGIALSQSRWAPASLFVQRLGVASLAIYLAHVIASAVFRIIASRLGLEDVWLHLVFGSFVGLLGPLVLLQLSRRFGGQRWLGF